MGGNDAVQPRAAWRDLSSQGRLRATGADRERLIHAICSNEVEGLAPGLGTYAYFLNPQGRIQSDSWIFVERDQLLIHCEPEAATLLRQHIETYIIMDDVAVEDIAARTALLAIYGPAAGRIVRDLGVSPPSRAMAFSSAGGLWCCIAPSAGVDYWVMVPSSMQASVQADLDRLGAKPVSEAQWEAHRVSHWVPRFGTDFNSSNIPHETRQFNAVSFTKGCYTGQEIVERVRSRGQVRRELVGIELASSAVPEDLTVRYRGATVGALTSPTPAVRPGGRASGFAIVRTVASEPGTAIHVGEIPGRVRDITRNGGPGMASDTRTDASVSACPQ